jgi:hypothetical protein
VQMVRPAIPAASTHSQRRLCRNIKTMGSAAVHISTVPQTDCMQGIDHQRQCSTLSAVCSAFWVCPALSAACF